MEMAVKSLDWLHFPRKGNKCKLHVPNTLYSWCDVYWLAYSDLWSYGTRTWWKMSPLRQHNRNHLHGWHNFVASLL